VTTSQPSSKEVTSILCAGTKDEFIDYCLANNVDSKQLVLAGNSKIATYDGDGIQQYDSLEDYCNGKPSQVWPTVGPIDSIVANEVGFTALHANKNVIYTWGDARYPACIGRDMSALTPHPLLSIGESFEGDQVSIKKISSGGYSTAALLTTNDVYFWGE
jgi:hypothetical protein